MLVPQPVPGTHVTTGPEAIRSFATMFRNAIPDLMVSIDDVIAAEDKVVARVTWKGTQKGQLFGADHLFDLRRCAVVHNLRGSQRPLVDQERAATAAGTEHTRTL